MGGMYPYAPQQPPPPKKGLGFGVWAGLILVACFVSVAGVFCYAVSRKPSAEDQRKTEEILAAAADAAAQQKAAMEKDWRDGCKLKASAPIYVVYDRDLRERCEAMISESLKVPGSGDFPSEREQPTNLTSDDGCNRIFTSYVDATNAFGVKVRTRYVCTYDPRTGLYGTKALH